MLNPLTEGAAFEIALENTQRGRVLNTATKMMSCGRKHERPILIEDERSHRTSERAMTTDPTQAADLLLFLASQSNKISGGRKSPVLSGASNGSNKRRKPRALKAPPRLEKRQLVSEDKKEGVAKRLKTIDYRVIYIKTHGSEHDDDGRDSYAGNDDPPVELALAPPPRLPRVNAGIVVVPFGFPPQLGQ